MKLVLFVVTALVSRLALITDSSDIRSSFKLKVKLTLDRADAVDARLAPYLRVLVSQGKGL